MVLQKRLEYGFNGYQVPPTPRAARSARRRVSSWKKAEDNQMCAFDLLATVAGKLLLEGETSPPSSNNAFREEECEVPKDSPNTEQPVEDPMDVNPCDQGSCNRSFFVSELLAQAPVVNNSVEESLHAQNDTCSGLASGITISDFSEKVVPAPKVVNVESRKAVVDANSSGCKVLFGCKLDSANNKQVKTEPPNTGIGSLSARADKLCSENAGVWKNSPPAFVSSDNSARLPFCKDHSPRSSFPVCQDNVKLVIRDDDEKSSGCTQPRTLNKAFRPQPRIGDRRIRRLLASKYWKVAPKLKDDMHFSNDEEMKHAYRNRNNCFKRQRALRDYPFKKRRLYELSSMSNSEGGISSDGMSSSPGNGLNEDGSSAAKKLPGATGTSFAAGQQVSFRSRDSHVKLKIKSFRVPELFIEIPETATVGSLKRTVMEAVTAILQGELRVGVLLQGKKIRDDNKTLLQTGISHDDKLDALGFILEPNSPQAHTPKCREDHSFLQSCDTPQILTRYPSTPTPVNQIVPQEISDAAAPDPQVTNFGNLVESDHDSAPSPPEISTDKCMTDSSRALVTVPAVNVEALAVVPMRKSKRAEVAQRRIRRPFSVSEVEALVQAVEKLGTGRWRDVKLQAFDNAKHRTYVDLKDKWKTLVHTARISPQQRRGEPVPQELLDRVLAAHAYWSHHQAKQRFKSQPETCLLL